MKLAELGEPEIDEWLNYSSLGITEEHIPELIEFFKDENYGFNADDCINCWGQLHAWRALGQLRAKEAVPSLIEHLDNQDYSDWANEELPEVFAMICKDSIGPFRDFLFDDSKAETSRITIAHSLEWIAQENPELKEDCINAFSEFLEQGKEDCPDLNGFIVGYLVDLNAIDKIELVREAFNKGIVSEFILGDIEDVEILFGLREERATPKRKYYHSSFWDSEPDFKIQMPIVKEKKPGRNEPCFCGSGKKYKKCCL
jgi:hypothetical protein